MFSSTRPVVDPSAKPTAVILYGVADMPRPTEIDVNTAILTGATMAPSVDLLNSQFRTIRHYGFDAFIRRGADFSLAVFINPDDRNAAFLAIRSDPTFVGRQWTSLGSESNIVPVLLPPGVLFVPTGHEIETRHELTAGGQLAVTRTAPSR